MIKRGSGIFKVFLFTEVVALVVFIALATMTNMLDIVRVEWCLVGLFLVCTLLPFLVETILYLIGRASKKIQKHERDLTLTYEPVDVEKGKAYIETIADGKVQFLFFLPDGRIVLTPKEDTEFFPVGTVGENKIVIQKTGYVCSSFYQALYNTSPIVTYKVYGNQMCKNTETPEENPLPEDLGELDI